MAYFDIFTITLQNIAGNKYLDESLPDELGMLKELSYLDLSAGYLTGILPTVLVKLEHLGKSIPPPLLKTFLCMVSIHVKLFYYLLSSVILYVHSLALGYITENNRTYPLASPVSS